MLRLLVLTSRQASHRDAWEGGNQAEEQSLAAIVDHSHVGLSVELFLWEDDLNGSGVVGVRDWVAHNADRSHHLSALHHLLQNGMSISQQITSNFCSVDYAHIVSRGT